MNPEEEKTIPVQAVDAGSGQTTPEPAGSADMTGTVTASDTPAADVSATQEALGSQQTSQGYQQNPNAQFYGAQGYQQNPNAQFNGAQWYQQSPNAQFNGAQGYQQNPNAQFNGAQGFTQGFQNMTGTAGNSGYNAGTNQSDTQYYNNQNYQQNPNAQFNGAQGYQNPYYVNPASIPPTAVPKKKSKKMIWIPIVSVVLVAAIAVGIYFLVSKKPHNPEEAITAAMSNTFSAERTSTAAGWLSSQDLSMLTQNSSYQVNMDMTIDEVSGSLAEDISMLEGFGFTTAAAIDLNAARYAGGGSILYDGTSYIDYDIYAYDDYIALACPSLFEGYIEFKTTNFGTDFNNSPLAEALDTTIDPSIGFQFFELFTTAQETDVEVPHEFQEFLDSIRYEEGDKKDLQVNGKSQTCQGYRIVVPRDSMENLLRWLCDYAGSLGTPVEYEEIAEILPREDFVMNVYVDNKGRMARFSFELPIESAQTELSCQIDFTGLGDNPADHVTGNITMNIEGYAYGFSFESTTNTSGATTTQNTTMSVDVSGISVANATYVSTFDTETKDAHMDLSVSAMYTSILSMNLDYSYTDVVPGEQFTVNLEDLTLDIAGELTIGLSGSSTVSKLNGSVEEPSGTKYDLFTMTEDDFNVLAEEIMENMLNGPLGSFIAGGLYNDDDIFYDDEYNW